MTQMLMVWEVARDVANRPLTDYSNRMLALGPPTATLLVREGSLATAMAEVKRMLRGQMVDGVLLRPDDTAAPEAIIGAVCNVDTFKGLGMAPGDAAAPIVIEELQVGLPPCDDEGEGGGENQEEGQGQDGEAGEEVQPPAEGAEPPMPQMPPEHPDLTALDAHMLAGAAVVGAEEDEDEEEDEVVGLETAVGLAAQAMDGEVTPNG